MQKEDWVQETIDYATIIKLALIIIQIIIERIIRHRFSYWADGTPRKQHEKEKTVPTQNL